MRRYKVIIKKSWLDTEFVFSLVSEATKFMAEVVKSYHKKDDKDDDIEVLLKIDEPKEEKQEEVKNESIPD